MDEMIAPNCASVLRAPSRVRETLAPIEQEVVEGRLSPFRAATPLIDFYYKEN